MLIVWQTTCWIDPITKARYTFVLYESVWGCSAVIFAGIVAISVHCNLPLYDKGLPLIVIQNFIFEVNLDIESKICMNTENLSINKNIFRHFIS